MQPKASISLLVAHAKPWASTGSTTSRPCASMVINKLPIPPRRQGRSVGVDVGRLLVHHVVGSKAGGQCTPSCVLTEIRRLSEMRSRSGEGTVEWVVACGVPSSGSRSASGAARPGIDGSALRWSVHTVRPAFTGGVASKVLPPASVTIEEGEEVT